MLIARVVYLLFNLVLLGLLIYVFLGWFPAFWNVRARAWLAQWYEPMLTQLRRFLPPVGLGPASVDLTPLALMVILVLARSIVTGLLRVPF